MKYKIESEWHWFRWLATDIEDESIAIDVAGWWWKWSEIWYNELSRNQILMQRKDTHNISLIASTLSLRMQKAFTNPSHACVSWWGWCNWILYSKIFCKQTNILMELIKFTKAYVSEQLLLLLFTGKLFSHRKHCIDMFRNSNNAHEVQSNVLLPNCTQSLKFLVFVHCKH